MWCVVCATTASLLTSMASVPASGTLPAGLPKPCPGQQLILTQGAGGELSLSQVLLPARGPGAATGQPFFFTTQVHLHQTGIDQSSVLSTKKNDSKGQELTTTHRETKTHCTKNLEKQAIKNIPNHKINVSVA